MAIDKNCKCYCAIYMVLERFGHACAPNSSSLDRWFRQQGVCWMRTLAAEFVTHSPRGLWPAGFIVSRCSKCSRSAICLFVFNETRWTRMPSWSTKGSRSKGFCNAIPKIAIIVYYCLDVRDLWCIIAAQQAGKRVHICQLEIGYYYA